jgi:hypothetical protein
MPEADPSGLPAPVGHAALALLSLLPLVVHVPTNLNIVLTAVLTVWVGSWRSVKPEPPAEAMSKKVPPAAAGCAHWRADCCTCCTHAFMLRSVLTD